MIEARETESEVALIEDMIYNWRKLFKVSKENEIPYLNKNEKLGCTTGY